MSWVRRASFVVRGLAWVLLIWFGTSTLACAESPYTLDLHVDLPLFGIGAAVGLAGLLESAPLPACAPACPSTNINALDRTALHFRSDASGTAADIMLAALLVMPVVLDAFDSDSFTAWFKDTFVIAQTLMLTQGITQLTKFAVDRNSPALYDRDPSLAALRDSDASRSFFSAHTASAFAVTTAFTVTYWKRHPKDPMRFVVLALGAVLSLTTGTLKVLAGAHFWTDIGAGAVLGASMGVLVPTLHTSW
jgi:membrane-associated phospholipid phosphatase